MKKIILTSTLASLFLIAAAFMKPPAVVTNFHDQYTTTDTRTNTCNGENILVTEVVTEDVHSVINDNKANITTHFHFDMTGVGDQGNTYHGVENEVVTQNEFLQNGVYTETINLHETLVSNGNAPNIKSSVQFRVTVTPNGDITVVKDNESFQCE